MTTREEMARAITRSARKKLAAALNAARITRANICADQQIQAGESYASSGAIRLNRVDAIKFFALVAAGGERSMVDFLPGRLVITYASGASSDVPFEECSVARDSYSAWIDGAVAERMVAALEEVDISAYPHAYGHWARYVQLWPDRYPIRLGIKASMVLADARHASVRIALTGRDDPSSEPHAVRIGTWMSPEERREIEL